MSEDVPAPASATATHFVIIIGGRVVGTGYTPDGTLPPHALACDETTARAAGPWSEVVDGRLVVGTAPPPAAPPPIRAIAPYYFRLRLPAATRGAITLAASQALEAGDPTLQTWLDDLSSARNVQLDHPDVAAGVAMLHAAGLITEAQATALLADGTAEEV